MTTPGMNPMKRIVVIGNAGGGKSTLARDLSAFQKIPYYAVDNIQWQPGWLRTPSAQFNIIHEEIISKPRWIIDGFGDWSSIEKRIHVADTIIYIDLHIAIHYWWATKRQFKCLLYECYDGPKGCPMPPVTFKLFKMMWKIHTRDRAKILNIIKLYISQKEIFHIKSPKALKKFMQIYANNS